MRFLLLHYYENQRSMRCFSIASESGALDLADVMGRGRTAIVQYIGIPTVILHAYSFIDHRKLIFVRSRFNSLNIFYNSLLRSITSKIIQFITFFLYFITD